MYAFAIVSPAMQIMKVSGIVRSCSGEEEDLGSMQPTG